MKLIEILSFFMLIILLSIFGGCKKIIDVNLNNADPKYVITGEVTNQARPYKVTIFKTVNFSADNIFPPVSDALVTISENGIADTLQENEPGNYFSTKLLKGSAGKTYTLNIKVEGHAFSATSVMPKPVNLDSIGFMKGRDKNSIYPVVFFADPPAEQNYYQFIQFVHGKKLENNRGNTVFEDRLSDGRYISYILYNDSTEFKKADTLTIQMNSIDKQVYEFFSQLRQVSNGSGSGFSTPTPVNPSSNISGGALGYFNAYSISTKQAIVP